MIVYKVCRKPYPEFERYYKSYLPQDYSLQYELNEKTLPDVGKIFCFDTLENAKIFAGNAPFHILKCKGKKAKYQRKYIIRNANAFNVENCWLKKGYLRGLRNTYPTLGTIFMDWIIPLEEV